jgi:hypothetical protein
VLVWLEVAVSLVWLGPTMVVDAWVGWLVDGGCVGWLVDAWVGWWSCSSGVFLKVGCS